MPTNLIGKGTKTIGINMDEKLAGELAKRANSMHISTSNSCKIRSIALFGVAWGAPFIYVV